MIAVNQSVAKRPTRAEVQVAGRSIPVQIRWVDGGSRVSVVTSFGVVDVSIGTRLDVDRGLRATCRILEKGYRKALDSMTFERMLDWEHREVWILGEKLRIAPGEPGAFDAPREADGFTRSYDRQFRAYLKKEILSEAQRGRIELPDDFRIRLGKFRSMLASYNFRKRTFTFDRRLYAFRPEVIRSVVDHELSHVHHPDHGPEFKRQLYSLMKKKTYERCREIITQGQFSRYPDEEK